MSQGNLEQSELGLYITNLIRREGKITFARFMELALYHPTMGYYTGPGKKLGREGDFYTSAHVHALFGQCLADQLQEMWLRVGKGPFIVVEYGGGHGWMARDILDRIRDSHQELWSALKYNIIEISPELIRQQQELLSEKENLAAAVNWFTDISQVAGAPGFTGCILSNELVDAFPVHRVKCEGERIREVYVDAQGGHLVEVIDEPSRAELSDYFRRQGVSLEEGQEAEVNLAALEWLDKVALNLGRGYILTIDYGDEGRALYSHARFKGTVTGYYQHRQVSNLYANIGLQDLTAHVNFSALMSRGQERGLITVGYTNQMKFLVATGILQRLTEWQGDKAAYAKASLGVKRLIMPEGMGEIFKVLVQSRGVDMPKLQGLGKPF
ncbi:MAG: class I SAM-dependent methyltransferase [Bacillota bacterium]